MKILVNNNVTGEDISVECESTDTIAHLKAKLGNFTCDLMFDGKLLGDNFTENMLLADVGVQDGSLILDSTRRRRLHKRASGGLERLRRRPEYDYPYYADASKFGWREEHAIALLNLLLKLCQDGTISGGNVTDEAWLRIQDGLINITNCSFQMDFLKERLRDYMQLYSVLTDQTGSSIFNWDRERKTITSILNWREEYPELLLLYGPYIPYFDILEEIFFLLNTR